MFADRVDAGRRLADRLGALRDQPVVVLGLPRGGVPVAAEVADALGAPLDVIVVRKLGVPSQPELAMGAIGEGDVRVVDERLRARASVTDAQLAAVEGREREALEARARRLRGERPALPLDGCVAVVVDDGLATGSTARAACRSARARGAARVVLAVPVAPRRWIDDMGDAADDYACVETPSPFGAVGQAYADFSPTSDDEVVACLRRVRHPHVQEVEVPVTPVRLPGLLTVPPHARGVVVFAHGSGSSRHSPRNRAVAARLHRAGLASLLFDLLTEDEQRQRSNVYDIGLLGERLVDALRWVGDRPPVAALPVGLFGASTGAAAALWAAADPGSDVRAVVSRGGRPDLTGPRLGEVRAPTLLVVGGEDRLVLELNREARARLRCESELLVVPGASHLFAEPGALEAVADAAAAWFTDHLAG